MNNQFNSIAKDSAEVLEALMTIRKSVSQQQLQQQQQQQQQQQATSMTHPQQAQAQATSQYPAHQHQHQQHQIQQPSQITSNPVMPGALSVAPTSSLPLPNVNVNVNPFAHAAHSHAHAHAHQAQAQTQAPQGGMFPPAYNSLPLHTHSHTHTHHTSPNANVNVNPQTSLNPMGVNVGMNVAAAGLYHNPLMPQPGGTNFGAPLVTNYTASAAAAAAAPGGTLMPKPDLQTQTNSSNISTHHQDDGKVRVDEVERALKSKPQRGKKRENLTISEKKELTKTRNRMHATKTRIRKKARHDELVECEKEYHKLLKEKEQETSRKKSILSFMVLRTKILNMKHTNDDSDDGTCSWKKTFGHDIKAASRALALVLDLPDIFVPNAVFYVGSNAMDLRGMYEFEHHFADELRDTFGGGENDDTKLEYVIPSGEDGIALSNISTAYAEYKLISGSSSSSTDENHKNIVSGGMIQVQFERDSEKIASVKIHVAPHSHSHPQGVVAPQDISMNDGLGERDCFPSVVSLDQQQQQQSDKKLPSSSDHQAI